MVEIAYYERNGKCPVREYIRGKEEKTREKIISYISILRRFGSSLGMPYVKKVEDKIFELRVEYAGNNHRLFYFFWIEKRIVFVHAVDKKKQKLDRVDIETAIRRMREIV